jgi:hypothetical protein
MTVERKTLTRADGVVVTINIPTTPLPVYDDVPVVKLLPGRDDPNVRPPQPRPIPSPGEWKQLPASSKSAFLARLSSRVEQWIGLEVLKQLKAEYTPEQFAAEIAGGSYPFLERYWSILLRNARDETTFITWLRAVRQDFDRARSLVLANGWTDDTPVPLEIFGPL